MKRVIKQVDRLIHHTGARYVVKKALSPAVEARREATFPEEGCVYTSVGVRRDQECVCVCSSGPNAWVEATFWDCTYIHAIICTTYALFSHLTKRHPFPHKNSRRAKNRRLVDWIGPLSNKREEIVRCESESCVEI